MNSSDFNSLVNQVDEQRDIIKTQKDMINKLQDENAQLKQDLIDSKETLNNVFKYLKNI